MADEAKVFSTLFNVLKKPVGKFVTGLENKLNPAMIQDAIAKYIPTSEAKITQNIRQAAPEFLKNPEGFSFNPRTGRFLTPGEDKGFMMATQPNPVDQSNTVPANVTDILSYAQKPEVMAALRRGQYLGGWSESPGMLTLDPATRFKDKLKSVAAGVRAEQRAGFDLGNIEEYKLTDALKTEASNKASRQMLTGLGQTLGGAGLQVGNNISNADSTEPASNIDKAVDIASLLLMARGGRNLAKGYNIKDLMFTNTAPVKQSYGLVNKPPKYKAMATLDAITLGLAEKAGIALSRYTPKAGDVASTVKNTVDELNNPELSKAVAEAVKDGDNQGTAYSKAYDIFYKKIIEPYYKPLTAKERLDVIERVKNRKPKISEDDVDLVARMVESDVQKPTRKISRKPLKVTKDYEEVGKKQLDYHPDDIGYLSGDELKKQIEILMYNFMKDIDPEKVAFVKENMNGKSIFYFGQYLKENAYNGLTETSNVLGELLSAMASANSKPVPETEKAMAIRAFDSLNRLADDLERTKMIPSSKHFSGVTKYKQAKDKEGNLLFKDTEKKEPIYTKEKSDELVAKEKERALDKKTGLVYKNIPVEDSTTGEMDRLLYAIREVIDNPSLLKDPRQIKGIQIKIASYLNNKSTMDASRAVTHDSWMVRSGSGNNYQKTDINPKTGKRYSKTGPIVEEPTTKVFNAIFEVLADKYGVTPQALQDIIWFETRVVNKEGHEVPFRELSDTRITQPYGVSGPNAIELTRRDTQYAEDQRKFAEKLISLAETDPELRSQLQISGADLQFTPQGVSKFVSSATLKDAKKAQAAAKKAKKNKDLKP